MTEDKDDSAPSSRRTASAPDLGRCGNYELLVELASGGMATVYLGRALDHEVGALVAIKRPHRHLAKDKVYLSMLVDEARLASAIEHDNVVKVRELGFDAGEPFIVLDYIEGASLSDIRKDLGELRRALDPRVAVKMALDALAGLQAAHVLHDDDGRHLGIIHRDVSPHNVIIGCDGTARLTDFGIAKAADRVQVTRTHEVKGKLAYLAPERIDKRRICTVQSDVFSMAVVLWEAIAGRRLFRGDEALDTLQEVITAPIPPLKKLGVPISSALDAAILRGLARDLDKRYATAAEFAAGLERAAGPANVATSAEVACVIEALFGDRLRVRHEKLREALGPRASAIFEVTGLPERPAPTPEMRERDRLAVENVAPPAPSARYAFGQATADVDEPAPATGRARRAVIAGMAVATLTLGWLVHRALRHDAPKVDPTASVSARPTPAAATARRVVVPLPFPAHRVALDDQTRDLNPAADLATFEVPSTSGPAHRVVAFGEGGVRAEAFVRELDGVVRPDAPGFVVHKPDDPVIELEPSSPSEPRRPKQAGARRDPPLPPSPVPPPVTAGPRPVGTVKDGFTKLR